MSYVDGLLSTGERITRRERQHWFILVNRAKWALLALVAAVVILFLSGNLGDDGFFGTVGDITGYVVLIAVVVSIAYMLWAFLSWQNEEFVITNRRVVVVGGVINKHASDSSLEKINDAKIEQSLFGRMFNFGDLDILTAADTGVDHMQMLADPIEFKRSMLDAKHELERELTVPSMPSPALRAATPGAAVADAPTSAPAPTPAPAPAPTPAPAAPPPTPATPSADEVTRTLASLADLRDRGAITPEEYEAKKAELLAKL
jgi:hypothetical protein